MFKCPQLRVESKSCTDWCRTRPQDARHLLRACGCNSIASPLLALRKLRRLGLPGPPGDSTVHLAIPSAGRVRMLRSRLLVHVPDSGFHGSSWRRVGFGCALGTVRGGGHLVSAKAPDAEDVRPAGRVADPRAERVAVLCEPTLPSDLLEFRPEVRQS